jgi:PPOX class probable F420-dependent enzyme
VSDEGSVTHVMMPIAPTAAAFLNIARLARVSTVNEDGSPHVVPMWFAPVTDGFNFTSRRPRRTVRNLLRDGRIAFVVDDDNPQTYRAVFVEGRAYFLESGVPEVVRTIVHRYLPPPAGDRYAAYMLTQSDRIVFRVVPHRVSHWGLEAPDSVARVLRGERPEPFP